jgi:hypothetical protein
MAAEKKVLTIGSVTYVMRHAPASTALRAAATLANGLAPLINGYRRASGGDASKVMLGVAEALSDPGLAANVEALCNAFSPYTQVIWRDEKGEERSRDLGGERGIFDEHFAGRIDALMTWLRTAVEYDLGGFLAEAKAKLAAMRPPSASEAGSKSESPPAAAKTG